MLTAGDIAARDAAVHEFYRKAAYIKAGDFSSACGSSASRGPLPGLGAFSDSTINFHFREHFVLTITSASSRRFQELEPQRPRRQ
jgi:hypothetical protein